MGQTQPNSPQPDQVIASLYERLDRYLSPWYPENDHRQQTHPEIEMLPTGAIINIATKIMERIVRIGHNEPQQ